MEGSARTAVWASGGRQAPRMTCAGIWAPILVLSVSARSISVRIPNP